jgi:hypothetical protein
MTTRQCGNSGFKMKNIFKIAYKTDILCYRVGQKLQFLQAMHGGHAWLTTAKNLFDKQPAYCSKFYKPEFAKRKTVRRFYCPAPKSPDKLLGSPERRTGRLLRRAVLWKTT